MYTKQLDGQNAGEMNWIRFEHFVDFKMTLCSFAGKIIEFKYFKNIYFLGSISIHFYELNNI